MGCYSPPRDHRGLRQRLQHLKLIVFVVLVGESRLYPQFMNGLDQHTEIVTEHLTQYLIELPDITFAPYRVPKLRLDHAKGGFHVGPLVIMR